MVANFNTNTCKVESCQLCKQYGEYVERTFFRDNDALVVISPRCGGCYNDLYYKQNPMSCSPLYVLCKYAKNRKEKGFVQGDLFPNRNRKSARKGSKYVASINASLAINDFWNHLIAHLVTHVSKDCKTIITMLISLIFKEI